MLTRFMTEWFGETSKWVDATINGVEAARETEQAFVVKIDKWFSRRWLGFSGKALGAISVRKRWLTVPPFVPRRVRKVRRFWSDGVKPGRFPKIHRWQRSSQNLQRQMDRIFPGASVFWYSGGTKHLDRGCLMAYVDTPEGHWPWYVDLHNKTTGWEVAQCIGVDHREIAVFRERGLTSA